MRTKPGGVDATVLTGAFGGGGHARAAGATVALPVAEARPRGPRRGGAAGRRGRAADVAPRSARAWTASSSSPSRPGRPRTTSSRWSAGWRRRRVGHGGTLDPFASGVLPLFLGRDAARRVPPRRRKRYRATICFGATSTTDDLDGELTPVAGRRRRGRPSRRRSPAFRGPIAQRPPAYSAIKVGGRRAYAMARAGETVELAPRDGRDPRARPRRVGRQRPRAARSRSSMSTCSAGTYVRRSPATSARPRRRGLPRRAGADRERAVRARRSASPRRRSAPPPPTGRPRLPPLLLPIDAGLERFAVAVAWPSGEVARSARGQFVRRAGRAGAARPRRRPLRLVDGAGAARGDRPARRHGGSRRTRCWSTPPAPSRRRRRRRWRSSPGVERLRAPSDGPVVRRSSASSTGCTAATPTCSRPRRARPRARRPAGGDHVRPPPGRGPDRARRRRC